MSDIRTDNDFFLGTNGNEVAPMLPVIIASKEQAYRTAAWIKLMGEMLPSEGEGTTTFEEVENAIMNT
jgi:hypothetical protein